MRAAVGGPLARVITEVEGLAGVVTSISGRGLEAVFGAPEAHKDNPRGRSGPRSAPCQRAHDTRAATSWPHGIGIETGPAVLWPIGAGTKSSTGPSEPLLARPLRSSRSLNRVRSW